MVFVYTALRPTLLLALTVVHAAGVVGLCLDVDGNAICHERAICYDGVEGGVECKCMDGYIGDGFTSCTGIYTYMYSCHRFQHMQLYSFD